MFYFKVNPYVTILYVFFGTTAETFFFVFIWQIRLYKTLNDMKELQFFTMNDVGMGSITLHKHTLPVTKYFSSKCDLCALVSVTSSETQMAAKWSIEYSLKLSVGVFLYKLHPFCIKNFLSESYRIYLEAHALSKKILCNGGICQVFISHSLNFKCCP